GGPGSAGVPATGPGGTGERRSPPPPRPPPLPMILTSLPSQSRWSPVSVAAPHARGQVGRGPAGRSGAAPHRAQIQAGSDGAGRTGAQTSPGRGTPRGEGSSRHQRQRRGRGRGGRPGAAPHGARVRTGGDGGSGDRPAGPTRRPTGHRFRRAATAAVGAGPGASPGRGQGHGGPAVGARAVRVAAHGVGGPASADTGVTPPPTTGTRTDDAPRAVSRRRCRRSSRAGCPRG